MKKLILLTLILLVQPALNAQDMQTPYDSIPDYPETYTPGTVVARMLDGLGFRYRWATEGLSEKEAGFRLSPDSRSLLELLQHIHGLSEIVVNSARKVSNDRTVQPSPPKQISTLREETLKNIVAARDLLAGSSDLSEHALVFRHKDRSAAFAFWHQINGPIADAIWHSGQVALMRRATGNPMREGVDVFLGKVKK